MPNEFGQNNGERIEKPYDPDIIKGRTVSNAPAIPVAPPPPPPAQKDEADD